MNASGPTSFIGAGVSVLPENRVPIVSQLGVNSGAACGAAPLGLAATLPILSGGQYTAVPGHPYWRYIDILDSKGVARAVK